MKKSRIIIAIIILAALFSKLWLTYQHTSKIHKHLPPPSKVTVCIDPGHPSESNSGRITQNGTCELEMNWEVALKLKKVLEQDKRLRVLLTREKRDTYMRNRKRALFANTEHASLAIHLHCDTGPSRGFTVYYPDRRGKSEGRRGPSRQVIMESHEAAIAVHQGLIDVVERRDRGLKGESVTRIGRAIGGLTYSIWSRVPTVTVEMGFLSNGPDAAYLKSSAGRDQMAWGLARGMKAYLKPQLSSYDRKYAHWWMLTR